jgi:hypothetical protein
LFAVPSARDDRVCVEEGFSSDLRHWSRRRDLTFLVRSLGGIELALSLLGLLGLEGRLLWWARGKGEGALNPKAIVYW